MNPWIATMEYLEEKMLWADEIAAPFLCSTGAHIANLRQQEMFINPKPESRAPFWYEKKVATTLNLPILSIAPSGLSKSYAMKFFLKVGRRSGILPWKTKMGGKITEAGFVGTVIPGEDGAVVKKRLASDYNQGIVGWDEASHIFHKSLVDKNTELINSMMSSITEGYVSKDLSGGEVAYPTCLTPWYAAQPGRFDMTGGLGRRVGFSFRPWRPADMLKLKYAMDEVTHENWEDVNDEREQIAFLINDAKEKFNPSGVSYPQATKDWLNKVCHSHMDKGTLRKFLIGRVVLEDPEADTLILSLNEERKTMLLKMHEDIWKIADGIDCHTIMDLIPGSSRDEPVAIDALWRDFTIVNMGVDRSTFNEILQRCVRNGLVYKENISNIGEAYWLPSEKRRRNRNSEEMEVA